MEESPGTDGSAFINGKWRCSGNFVWLCICSAKALMLRSADSAFSSVAKRSQTASSQACKTSSAFASAGIIWVKVYVPVFYMVGVTGVEPVTSCM